MSCCRSCFEEGSVDELEPLPVTRTPKQVKELQRGELLLVKKVNVAKYDDKFGEMGELYNKQVEQLAAMTHCLSQLAGGSNLAACLQALQDKYSSYDPELLMEGYNFSLVVRGGEDIPKGLQEAQNLVKQLSRATKLLLGGHSKLGGMVFSAAQEKPEMESTIKEANTAYLDQIRLVENLEENLRNMDRAKQLSAEYMEEANEVLQEVANILGLTI